MLTNMFGGALVFVNPWILAGLIALPLIWLILRVTPPAPKRIAFPAARFLKGLVPEDMSPAKTPWWLLLIRLLMLVCIIGALAHPITDLSSDMDEQRPVRLIVDNDWSSAANWNAKIREGLDILSQAKRAELPVTIYTTAPEGESGAPQSYGPVSASEAENILRGLVPKPWFADYAALSRLVEAQNNQDHLQTVWLSDGVQKDGISDLARALSATSTLIYMHPEDYRLPSALMTSNAYSGKPTVTLLLPSSPARPQSYNVQALAQDGRVIGYSSVTPAASDVSIDVSFDIPEVLRSEIARFVVVGSRSAGATYLVDDQYVRRNVGIISSDESAENAPLIEAQYYLERALEPYANITSGTISELLDANVSAIIMPDLATLPIETLNRLETWVKDGGLLLRFAGPAMTQNLSSQFLVPVPLRSGGRSLSGSLSWDKPQKLLPYPQNSPFFGQPVPDDVSVKQQILAEPVADLPDKTWATLEDGTPLITAAAHQDGLLVFVHTTATPEWSDLALSGAFVSMLRKIVNMSGRQIQTEAETAKTLEPLSVMDGFGAMQQPGAQVKPIFLQNPEEFQISPAHPPGLYGRAGVRQALNLGDSISSIRPATLPAGVNARIYDESFETDYRPALFSLAFTLLVLDWIILLLLNSQIGISALRRSKTAIAVGLAVLLFLQAPAATADDAFDMRYADQLHLAYIKTGSSSVDITSQQGLEVLANALQQRTSVEPAGAVGLNPETDTLAFFPLIYWPISGSEQALSLKALQNVQSYLDHGGTILFDTRDQNMAAQRLGGSRNAEVLRKMIAGLNIPALTPIPDDHVLGKSFYLLDQYPGQYSGGTLWVEGQSEDGRDGVSSVLIGSHDWASSWASSGGSRLVRGANRQQELSLRFGVNLMMYALTGNYKADQVHVPFILERLGQ